MNPRVMIAILWLFAAVIGQAESAEVKYSGKTYVEDLGLIAFPAGEWSLEMSRVQRDTNPEKQHREYFVFKRMDVEGERLTVLRYNPFVGSRTVQELFRGFEGTMGDGIPEEEKKADKNVPDIWRFRDLRKYEYGSGTRLDYSFITVFLKPQKLWICHTILVMHEGWSFILAHSSTTLNDPEMIENTEHNSNFLTELPKGLTVIPKRLVGEWEPVKRNTDGPDVIHLSADGKCIMGMGTVDMMIGAATGFYDASNRTLILGRYRFSVDEKALTLTPVKSKGKTPPSQTDQQYKKRNGENVFFSEEYRKHIYPSPRRDGIGGKQGD